MSSQITLPVLLKNALRFCQHIGASQEAKKTWREEIDKTPPHLYADLNDHFNWVIENLAPAKREAPTEAVQAAPTTKWMEADKASQQHDGRCPQCKAVELKKVGERCAEGQKLHDEYIEVASKENRLKTSIYSKKPSNSGTNWSVHAEWRKAYQDYYTHHCKCFTCKAASKSEHDSGRCAEGELLYSAYREAERRNQ